MQYEISTHARYGHRTIRNICITDCTRNEDYFRIIYLCGDYDIEAVILDRIATCGNEDNSPYPDVPLFDDKSSNGFMYFWRSAKQPTPDTHHFMTVQEFYDLFDPTSSTTAPYEYW